MKKFYLFMLMAVGLLISGNLRAVNQQNGHATQQEGDVAKMTVTNTEMGTEKVTYYATLQEAFDDLPDNSYPATVKMIANETMTYATNSLTIKQYQKVTLDLNGCKVYASSEQKANSSLITNKGTLTIEDSETGGLLSSLSTGAAQGTISQDGTGIIQVGYAVNVILNNGSLFVNGGTIENGTSIPTAAYCIDCCGGGYAEINGGHLINRTNPCIRLHNMTSNLGANVVINDGILESDRRTIWVQACNNQNPQMTLTINGGTLKTGPGSTYSSHNLVILAEADNKCNSKNVRITINGGKLYGDVAMDLQDNTYSEGWNTVQSVEDLAIINITGGEFLRNVTPATDYTGAANHAGAFLYRFTDTYREDEEVKFPAPKCITGGIFESAPNQIEGFYSTYTAEGEPEEVKNLQLKTWSQYIADGYTAIPYNENPTTKWIVVPTKKEELMVSGDINLSEQGETLDETTDLTITPSSESNTTINITENTNVNKIEVTTEDGKGEAQIVVHDGATLNVGNGGLVSNNDDLVFVKVEAGGKLTIGNGGLNQKGEQYPIIIENDGDNSGTYMVSPDATNTEVTEPEATVRVYTKAYMKTGMSNHWQQIACPVKNPEYMKMVKLGEQTDDLPNIATEVYGWNYANDSWSHIKTFTNIWDNPDLVPYKAYDLINNSLPDEGGVTYEFKGQLVGNKNMKLTFPEHGYCMFGNSYTAPVDLTVLFDQILNDINTENIDACVYIFNSKSDRFEAVNPTEIDLEAIGIGDVAFTQIPPQQAFIMNLIKGNSAETAIDYRNAVWGNTQTTGTPLRAPKNMDVTTVAKIVVADANSQDHVMVVEGSQYDAQYNRGADAEKYMDANHFNLYATTEAGNLAMVATDNLEGTTLTFQAGQEVEYTMTFANVLNNDYRLLDLLTNEVISLTEGNSYTFAAQPNSTEARFQIVSSAKAPTGVENTKAIATKGIYSVMGQYLGEAANWNNMPNGVYVINGVKVVK